MRGFREEMTRRMIKKHKEGNSGRVKGWDSRVVEEEEEEERERKKEQEQNYRKRKEVACPADGNSNNNNNNTYGEFYGEREEERKREAEKGEVRRGRNERQRMDSVIESRSCSMVYTCRRLGRFLLGFFTPFIITRKS